ncbi:AAA family ATPase [Novosphingobium album (ex Hu et al. 2023)]|uniref:ATP-binding protein n=1 Tax=Novosphingobium album (ex Hu et al. 2023) TaxID=2930093 RepID=A0ABT0B084_9SPHN|nr:ATP-binding protein [Novosphingobium album (ex Hu et al. 2023)]MCJ2178351.1 ATP-binding protein [Novosphingobium album (ex Hu et al. 2023)]
MKTVCLHGPESTGKTVLAGKLGYPWVPEYGRAYCEQRGTSLEMVDLLAIAEGQAAENRKAMVTELPLLVLDTDQLMTAAWAQMLFGEVPEALMAYPKADLYLLFAPDVPWFDDGTRFFGEYEKRSRFADLAEEMLTRAGVPYVRICGDWEQRERLAREAIGELFSFAP